MKNPWVVVSKPRPDARFRFFCFHYAGGSAGSFRGWAEELPADVELRAIQLPGRETRIREKAFERLEPIIPPLVDALAPDLDRPYYFFGHSMGTLVAFETLRELRRRGARMPERLLVSAYRAPQLPDPDPPISKLPEPEFIAAIKKLNGTPAEVLAHKELMALVLPILRSDFSVGENYAYREEPPFAFPISSFVGIEDPEIKPEQVDEWRAQTASRFTIQLFPGDHFYLIPGRAALLRSIRTLLASHAGTA